MEDRLLNWYQGMQLLALGPCLFMLFFLCLTARGFLQIIVPLLYFLSLGCSFLLPVMDALLPSPTWHAIAMTGESMTPALSFLLIGQFASGHVPGPPYWLVLAVPLVGGSSLLYAATLTQGEVCLSSLICAKPELFKEMYQILSAMLTFLLTWLLFRPQIFAPPSPLADARRDDATRQAHKRALVLALVLLNLLLLLVELLWMGQRIPAERALLAMTVLRLGFIYLVFTSVLRVFDRAVPLAYERIPHLQPALAAAETSPTPRDHQLALRLTTLLADEKLYRDLTLSREKLASKLAVNEHYLSRLVNQCLGQNLNALINHYRVEEAKARLKIETTPVTTIAFEVGFNSIPSFNRVFKQVTTLSPSEYRAKARLSLESTGLS